MRMGESRIKPRVRALVVHAEHRFHLIDDGEIFLVGPSLVSVFQSQDEPSLVRLSQTTAEKRVRTRITKRKIKAAQSTSRNNLGRSKANRSGEVIEDRQR